MSDVQKKEEGAEGEAVGPCAVCERHAAGGGCSPNCERVEVSTVELRYILGMSRSWVWRMGKRGILKRANAGPFPSYVWRAAKAGVMGYYGARWRLRLIAAEKRIGEVLSGRVVRKTTEKRKTKVQRKGKGRK